MSFVRKPETHALSGLSCAFIRAMAEAAGLRVDFVSQDQDYGVDGWLQGLERFRGAFHPSGIPVEFQLKATMAQIESPGGLRYDLDARTYNMLARRAQGPVPCLLFLVCVQGPVADAAEPVEGGLLLRAHGYWAQIPDGLVGNRSSKRILIPYSQKLSPNGMLSLLDKARSGAFL